MRTNGTWAALEFATKDALDLDTLKSNFGFLREAFPTNNPLWDMEYVSLSALHVTIGNHSALCA